MASKLADSAVEEIANSLTDADQVPTKLRCAICDKVAINAFKLPCCDQNMCGNCQTSLPESCPICQHSPLNAEDAKPSKSLRLTITQYLKNIKKKREKATTATTSDSTPTPAHQSMTPVVEAIPAAVVDATLEPSEVLTVPVDLIEVPAPDTKPVDLDPKSEVEVTAERVAEEDAELHKIDAAATESHDTAPDKSADVDDEGDADSDTSEIEIITGDEDKTAANPWGEVAEEDQEAQQGGLDPNWVGYHGQNQMGGQGYDMQGAANNMGMYANMNNNNDMMQYMMQQMGMSQQMMNVMPGMQGMNFGNMSQMDMMAQMAAFQQMQMQSMGGFGDMGNMGYNMNGNFGSGNGWNNQNMNNGTDFGAYPQDGGYNNQGNYPNNMSSNHRQFSKNDSYRDQPRERGSFRGSQRVFGRGNYRDERPGHGRSFSNAGPPVVSEGPPLNAPTGPKAQREPPAETYHSSSKAGSDRPQASPTNEGASRDTTNNNEQEVGTSAHETELELRLQQSSKDEQPKENGDTRLEEKLENGDQEKQTIGTPNEGYFDQRSQRGTFRGRGRGGEGRGGWRGREGWHAQGSRPEVPSAPAPAEPVGLGVPNAPSGPKAMREGAIRGRGGLHGRIHSQTFSSARQEEYAAPASSANNTAIHAISSIPGSRPRSRDTSVRDRSRSHERRQSIRHRSRTPSDSDYERRKERKRRRKYEEEYADNEEQIVDDGNEDKYRSGRRENERRRSSKSKRDTSRERRKDRRRSRSPAAVYEDELKINGHHEESKEKERSRRDKDKHRDRSRDRDRHREKDRDRERDKKRSSRRDRSASPDSKHRSSHRRDKEQDKEKERDRESRRASAASITKTSRVDNALAMQKQLEQGFRVAGRHKEKEKEKDKQKAEAAAAVVETPAPPTPVEPINDSAKMAPPTAPRADRSSGAPSKFKLDLANLSTRSTPNSSRRTSQSATPTSAKPAKPATPVDPYEEERRKAQEARIAKENSRRAGAPALAKKRSWADVGEEEPAPRSSERDSKTKRGRKMSYKYEDELEDESARREREFVAVQTKGIAERIHGNYYRPGKNEPLVRREDL